MEAFAGLAEKEQEPMQKKGQRNGKRNCQGVEVAHEAEPACGVSGWVLAAVAPSGGAGLVRMRDDLSCLWLKLFLKAGLLLSRIIMGFCSPLTAVKALSHWLSPV